MKKNFFYAGVLCLALVWVNRIEAKTTLTEPKLLPTHPLYSYKILGEELKRWFIFDTQKKLLYDLERSDERLSEITVLTGQLLAYQPPAVKGETTKRDKQRLLAQAPSTNNKTNAFVDFESKIRLTHQEMLTEAKRNIQRMENVAAVVRDMLFKARQEGDVVKSLCLNDKLSQIDVTVRSGKDRVVALEASMKKNDTETSHHEFVIITVLRQRVEQLSKEASQCIGFEGAFIGKTEVVTKIDPSVLESETGDRPFSPPDVLPPAPPPSVSVSASLLDAEFSKPSDVKILSAIHKSSEEYQDHLLSIEATIDTTQTWDSALLTVKMLIEDEKALSNLLQVTPPLLVDSLLEIERSQRSLVSKSLAHSLQLDYIKGVQLSSETLNVQAAHIVNAIHGSNGLEEINVGDNLGSSYELNGIPISNVTTQSIKTNAWLANADYQATVVESRLYSGKTHYERNLLTYESVLQKLPEEVRLKEEANFASDMFGHWEAFSMRKAMTNRPGSAVHLYELTGLSKQYEDIAVGTVAFAKPEAAAGLILGLMDREIKILHDQTGQPYRIQLRDGLTDYEQKLAFVVTLVDTQTGNLSPQLLLVNEELLKRGIIHAVYLTLLQDKTPEDQKSFVSGVVSEISDTIKESVARIKKYTPEEYKSRTGVYSAFEQGLSQGLLQGLANGLSQGMGQGMSQGINQGLSQGLTQGMSQGLNQGFLQGLQFATGSASTRLLYENLWDYYVDPPSATESALGYYHYISIGHGNEFDSGDEYSGDDDTQSEQLFLGGDDFGSGDDFSGGDDFGTDINAIIRNDPPGLIQRVPEGLQDPLDSLQESPTPTIKISAQPNPTLGTQNTVPPSPQMNTSAAPMPSSAVITPEQSQPSAPPTVNSPPPQETTQPPVYPSPLVQGAKTGEPWWINILRNFFNLE